MKSSSRLEERTIWALRLLSAVVALGLIGSIAVAQAPSTVVDPAEVRSLTSPDMAQWTALTGYKGQGYFKLALGLLGAIVFMLIQVRTRTPDRTLQDSRAFALLGGLMLWLVGAGIHVVSSRVADWATAAAIAFGLLGIVWFAVVFATRHRPWWPEMVRRGLLLTVVLSSAAAWTTFGFFHAGHFVKMHEFYHYYVGSKYFPENRYLGIYRCTVVAEAQQGLHVAGRKVRDLEQNRGGLAQEILAEGTDCLDVFSAERWAAFQQDIRRFRASQTPRRWWGNFADKGYNATPLWTAIGSPLANWDWGLRFRVRMALLSVIDPLLYAAALGLVYWAFGLEACALMALLLGIGGPWDFRFTGGGFARIPWFFSATAAVCLVKKGHAAWGGAALVASAMLRLFPAALFGGVALPAFVRALRHRTLSPAHRRMALGSLLGLALLVPLSISTGGPRIYSEFFANTLRHATTPLTNHAGLRALFSLDMDKRLAKTLEPLAEDPLATWREARVETFQKRKQYYWICSALLFALVGVAARRMADWERLIAGTLLVVTLVDLTSYYLLFMVLWAPLVSRNPRQTLLAIYMAVLTQLPVAMIRQLDLRDLVQSAIVIGFMCTILGMIALDPRRTADPEPTRV